MKQWIAQMMWGALSLLGKKAFKWFTDPARAQKNRYAHREMWSAFYESAHRKRSWWRIRVAEWYAIQWKLETPPMEAMTRGDLNPDMAKPPGDATLYRIH